MSTNNTTEAGAPVHETLLHLTCRLVRMDESHHPVNVASGFIVERQGSVFILSAGHALRKGRWCLETDVSFASTYETVCIPLNDVFWAGPMLHKDDLEFGFARLDIEMLQKEAQKNERLRDKNIEFFAYRGPMFDEPVLGKATYSYASGKGTTWEDESRKVLLREETGECGMTYEGRSQQGDLYCFLLPLAHKGHHYYCGASGSPIADEDGKVVSLLLKGNPEANMLYGLPLKDYIRLLDLELG
jgi:hypothetical protein